MSGLSEEIFETGDLIIKHITGELTEKEKQILDTWIVRSEENRQLFEQLVNPENLQKILRHYHEMVEIEKESKIRLND